jgi:FKBP-type peptidyl-prolyl cis-trans isomerase
MGQYLYAKIVHYSASTIRGWDDAVRQRPGADSGGHQTTDSTFHEPGDRGESGDQSRSDAESSHAQEGSRNHEERERVHAQDAKRQGTGLHRQGVPVDAAIVARGLKDAMAGTKPLLTDDEMKAVLTQLQNDVRQKMQAQQQEMQAKAHEAAAPARKEGEAFLAANKTKEGVVTLPSGLQYKILKVGTGPKPTASDKVSCNYRGTLIDGTEFDSSYKGGKPIEFPVSGVIHGWTEALQLMPVGSKWQLFIPSDLAYGDPGRPGIPPGATLVFEVELMSIVEQQK